MATQLYNFPSWSQKFPAEPGLSKSPRNQSEGRQKHLFVSGQLIIRLDVALFLTILTQIMPMQRRRIKKLLASTVFKNFMLFYKDEHLPKGPDTPSFTFSFRNPLKFITLGACLLKHSSTLCYVNIYFSFLASFLVPCHVCLSGKSDFRFWA